MKKNRDEALPPGLSLGVYKGDNLVFNSTGKWLYPLFELEDFLEHRQLDPGDLFLHDKIAGRAAASLIARMGFRACRIELLSRPAAEVFDAHGVAYSCSELVPRIACRTEELVSEEMSLDEVYRFLSRRAGLNRGAALRIRDLTAGYDAKTVLQGLDLEMEAGEQLVITGDNGAGKTTLLKAVLGTLSLSRGSIEITPQGKRQERSGLIGYVPQSGEGRPFPLSAREVVASGLIEKGLKRIERRYRVEIAMRRTGCFAYRDRNFFTLSGGERRRVSLARCLCQRAGIILLDEPTSFLDAPAKEELIEVLEKIERNQAPTILLVSHDHLWIQKLKWPVAELKEGRLWRNS